MGVLMMKIKIKNISNRLLDKNYTGINARPKIHPKFFPEAQVFCGEEIVMTVGGTREKYVVDIWSGNHPFFQGAGNVVVVDEGQVNRFKKRFAGLENLSTIQTISQ